jgi:hypothetical protein
MLEEIVKIVKKAGEIYKSAGKDLELRIRAAALTSLPNTIK